MEELRIIKFKTINGRDMILSNPRVSSSNTLDLLLIDCPNIIIKYEKKENRCIVDLNDKKCLIKLSDSDLRFLSDLFDKEFLKATNYYSSVRNNKIKYLLYEDEKIVTTEGILQVGFSNYYTDLTNHYLKSFNTSLNDLYNKAIKLKDKLKFVDDNLGKHYEFDLKSIGIGARNAKV